jgi:hypothetical protein
LWWLVKGAVTLLTCRKESIYEGKVVCFILFCSYEIHQTGMLQIVFLVSLESSDSGEVHGLWFHDVWTCGAKVLEY